MNRKLIMIASAVLMAVAGIYSSLSISSEKTNPAQQYPEMTEDDLLLKTVFEKYAKLSERDLSLVPEPERTLIALYSAHGIIGNGGFYYFFENDFSGTTGYAIIMQSYQNIGLTEHAKTIENIMRLFPEGKPSENLEQRRIFLDQYFNAEKPAFLKQVDEAEALFFKNYQEAFKKAIQYYKLKKSKLEARSWKLEAKNYKS